MLRWFTGLLLCLLVVASAYGGFVFVASERHMQSFSAPAEFTTPIPTDDEAIARGRHVANTRGCGGCHGHSYEGYMLWGEVPVPALSVLVESMTPAQFNAALRHGIDHTGRAMYWMPSYNFVRLTDTDVAELFAYLKSLPEEAIELPDRFMTWAVRHDIAFGLDSAIAEYVDDIPPLRGEALGDPSLVRGEYLAMTTCNECHGFSLRADQPWEGGGPDMVIISAYDEAQFRTLMKTGKAIGDRELELMSMIARDRFVHFTEQELDDLYGFLRHLAGEALAEEPAT